MGALGFYAWGINSHIFSKYFRRAARVNDKVKMPRQ
ncbi:L-aspartate transporter [Lacticaseibacillus paracasei subsp. paracasei CNCM I-4648]|nr:L-aspartate transporter [Lacticaseibacillus paracasei subsp. paracasei CNCM I-4648]